MAARIFKFIAITAMVFATGYYALIYLNNSSGMQEAGPAKEGPQDAGIQQGKKAQPEREAVKKKIRSVGGGAIVAPELPDDGRLTRLPDALPDTNGAARESSKTVLLKGATRSYPRPLALSAASFQSKDKIIHIAGIDPLAADAVCKNASGAWPCGKQARIEVQRLVRSRSLICRSPENNASRNGKVIREPNCKVGTYDLAEWLVSQGWAKAQQGELLKIMQKAKEEGKGQWKR